jgi:hypothetical protein
VHSHFLFYVAVSVAMIEVQELSKSFEAHQVLHRVNLTVKPGEKVSIDAKDNEIAIAGSFGSLRMPEKILAKSAVK